MANPLNRNLKKDDKLVMENGAIAEVDAGRIEGAAVLVGWIDTSVPKKQENAS